VSNSVKGELFREKINMILKFKDNVDTFTGGIMTNYLDFSVLLGQTAGK
jgi:hypothetical protein